MNTEERAKWMETRARGEGRFILFHGLLRIGLMFAVVKAIGNYFFKYGFTASKVGEYLVSGETIFNFFLEWLYFGLGMGLLLWRLNERELRKSEKDKT
jgi:hypothetical protein